MRGVWHHQDRRRRGPRELTGIVDLTRGEDHPTARLSGPGPGKVWHRVQELVGRARRRLPLRYPDRDSGSLPGTARTPSMTSSKTPPASSMPFTSSSSPATPQVRYAVASSKTPWVTADARVIPSTWSAIFCAPHTRRLTPRQQERLREAFVADEAHISVEVAYHCAQQVRDVFHQATPAQGRRLAAHLIERLPTCPIPEIARLGRTLRKWKDAFLAYFDTGGASNGPTEAINGHYRAGKTRRQRLPQPHQLPTPNAPHRRRPRRLHPHSTLKSLIRDGLEVLVERLDCHGLTQTTPTHICGTPGDGSLDILRCTTT